MILDGLLLFTGTSNGSSGGISSGAHTDAPTTGTQAATDVIDLGINDGIPGSSGGGGARDIAPGYPLYILAQVAVAFAGGTNIQVLIEGAPDNGSGAPGSYTTMYSGPVVVEADLVVGARLADITIPRPVPGQVMPRYIRMSFVSSGTHTAGQVTGAIVLNRDDQPMGSSGNMSGYPAGLNVAN